MKGYIKGKTIILLEELPDNLQEGDEVEIKISPAYPTKTTFPTFKLGIKGEYLNREKIYEAD